MGTVVSCVDSVCLVTLASRLELWLPWAGGPGALCAAAVPVQWPEPKRAWVRDSWGLPHRGHPGRIAEADVSSSQVSRAFRTRSGVGSMLGWWLELQQVRARRSQGPGLFWEVP